MSVQDVPLRLLAFGFPCQQGLCDRTGFPMLTCQVMDCARLCWGWGGSLHLDPHRVWRQRLGALGLWLRHGTGVICSSRGTRESLWSFASYKCQQIKPLQTCPRPARCIVADSHSTEAGMLMTGG